MEQMHNEVMDQLREQAASREAELKQIIDENSAALQAKEKEALDLHVTLTEAKERILREEERNRQREHELFAENLNIRRQQRDMKEMANEFMLKWRITEEQRAKLVDSFNELQAEGIVTRERLRDAWKKEVQETLTQLTKHHEQTLTLANAKAKEQQATLELLVSQYQENAKAAREELEAHQAQIGMGDTCIKILIDKYCQQLTKKIEETLRHAGQAWSAQAAELHILRADAENRRKEGRGFYKMDEHSIQTLRADLTEDYHNLVKSHTAAIKQLLEEFNDYQMMFLLEAKAYEQERLAALKNGAPTPTDHNDKPPIANTTEARQEGPAPADTHITTEPTTTTTTPPKPESTEDSPREDTVPPDSAAKPPSPTPHSEQPDQTHAPEDILGIFEEE